MTSAQLLRGFIEERLAAAAGEIFSVFERTIVRYEEELDRQRKLLEIRWEPEIRLHRTDPAQRAAAADRQLLPHQQGGGGGGGEPEEDEPPQIKEEEEELGEAGDPLQLGLEGGAFVTAFADQHSYFHQPEAAAAAAAPPPSRHPAADGRQPGEGVSCDGCYGDGLDDAPSWQKNSGTQTARPSLSGSTLAKRRQRRRGGGGGGGGDRKLSCKVCRQSFGARGELLAHARSHAEEKPYACEACGKRFGVHRNLLVHARTHTGEKPYACAMCGRSFSKHSNLLRHMRTHTGEKPFPCALCDKSFRQQSHLLRHRRTHRE